MPNSLPRLVTLLALASAALTAQVARQDNVVTLKNWATPLYWQPNRAEREASTKAVPQLQFSANAVSTDALTFVAITPCRLVDTRGAAAGFNAIAPFSGPSITPGGTLTIPVQEATSNSVPTPCGVIPSIAQAYSFNLTVVPAGGGAVDYVTLWPSGYTQPAVSTLDDPQGAIVSNAAIVAAGTSPNLVIAGYDGAVNVFNSGPATTDVVIDMNGYFAAPTDLNGNTAIGSQALAANGTGEYNTAVGSGALQGNTTGGDNTASGFYALAENTTGYYNTASGVSALAGNTTGNFNTASGVSALAGNTTGYSNTAVGYQALIDNTTGTFNTASGSAALAGNATGSNNTADGYEALWSNTASSNTAVGYQALYYNTTGAGNTAVGAGALEANIGDNNIAIGYKAGTAWPGPPFLLSSGSNNIDIGNTGALSDGTAADSGVIRIGTVGAQTSAYIAGVYGGTPSTPNLPICVDSNGTLGTTGCGSAPSSVRFKEKVADMGDSSSKLLQLRPVTFRYKSQYDDGSHALQYGLIAEEVAKLYPEMVGYDKDGQPSSVKYQSLTPMLLNEVQKQNAQIRSLEDRLAAVEALLSRQTATPEQPSGNQ